jgi:hypothetical protein
VGRVTVLGAVAVEAVIIIETVGEVLQLAHLPAILRGRCECRYPVTVDPAPGQALELPHIDPG